MKILICNIPLRDKTTTFPPVACTTLCNVLISAGYDPVFYDIDAKRPSAEELFDFFQKEKFDVVGISAVASTGYRYTKFLANIIKKASPDTAIILGGNLAAVCDIILRRCPINICVIGEGEKVLLNLIKYFEKYRSFSQEVKYLQEIKGIVFLDEQEMCHFTGYEKQIEPHEIMQADYEMIDKFSDINKYITNPMDSYDFKSDSRSIQPHRLGKKMATVFTSKGCVNRCSFCHRWVRGYRTIPIKKVIETMSFLKQHYNVGFFSIGVECFGEDRSWLEEFIKLIKPLDVLFKIAGARVTIIKEDITILKRLKEAGLSAVYFGMESGSDKILKIMEKNVAVEDNVYAAGLCAKEGIFTVIQLVIGMPGDNEHTINETINFIGNATKNLSCMPLLSINYLQALPGTPTYEFLRNKRLVGESIEAQEGYLLHVSDTNANDLRHYMNVTEEPLSKVMLWQRKISLLPKINWMKQRRWNIDAHILKENEYAQDRNSLAKYIRWLIFSKKGTYMLINTAGGFYWGVMLFMKRCLLYGIKKALLITSRFKVEDDRSDFKINGVALRKIIGSKKFDNISAKNLRENKNCEVVNSV